MANKINTASFFKFTFLVWVKSVFFILIGIGIAFIFNGDYPSSSFDIGHLGSALLISLLAYMYTAPFAIIMLIVVYLLNRTKLEITLQKLIIFGVYTLPFLFLFFIEPNSSSFQDTEVLMLIGLILLIPAIMIYLTELLPTNRQLATKDGRDDVIDDLRF